MTDDIKNYQTTDWHGHKPVAVDLYRAADFEFGRAWRETVAVLDGKFLKVVGSEGNPSYWRAVAFTWVGKARPNKDYREVQGRGRTPADALRALTAKLHRTSDTLDRLEKRK